MTEDIQISDLSGISLLIAEQNPHLRLQIHSILRGYKSCEIIEADTTEQAWHIFCSHQPDVLFVDWAPGFDGISLLQRIRRDKDSPNPFTPVLVITAHTENKYVFSARDLCMTEFIAKPISPRRILQRLQSIAEQPRPFDRTSTNDGANPDQNVTGKAESHVAAYGPGKTGVPIKIDTKA